MQKDSRRCSLSAVPSPRGPSFLLSRFMVKNKSSKKSALVKSILSIPSPQPALPPSLPMDDTLPPQSAEGSQDRASSFDIVPTPMSIPDAPPIPQYVGTYSNPPSRAATPPIPTAEYEQPQREPMGRGNPRASPTSARRRTNFGSSMPRSAAPAGDEPRMGDYFTKRRELLDVLKSLHSTG